MNILICANGKRDSVMNVLLSIWPNREATGLPMWIENNLEGLNFIRGFPAKNIVSDWLIYWPAKSCH